MKEMKKMFFKKKGMQQQQFSIEFSPTSLTLSKDKNTTLSSSNRFLSFATPNVSPPCNITLSK
jgi:hypothetical protein